MDLEPKTNASNESSFLQDFFCFEKIFETVFYYWRLVAIFAFLGMLLAVVATKFWIKPRYTSSTLLYAWESNQGDERDAITAYQQKISLLNMLINDYEEFLTSDRVQNRVKDAVNSFCERENIQIKGKKYTLSVNGKRDTRFLNISAESPDPRVAQFAANTAADTFAATVRDIIRMDNIQTVDPAPLPLKKSNHSLKFNIVVGFVIGLVGGLSIAILLGVLDQSIKTPDQATRYLKQSIIGTIPLISDKSSSETPLWMLLKDEKNYEFSEACRLLRANLSYLMLRNGGNSSNGGQVVVATSTVESEGKSTMISCLAILLAQTDKKVIIVDADLRRPSVHNNFDLPNSKGLISHIMDMNTLDDVIYHKVAENDTLDVITSGPLQPNPSEILLSKAFRDVIDELRKRYDYVLVDAPPALFLSDPLVVSQLADAVIFTVACGKAKINLVRKAINQLRQVTQIPLGLVVNMFNRKVQYGYYRRYYRNYSFKR